MKCCRCDKERPDSEMRKGRNGRLRSPCRSCGNRYNRERRKILPELYRKWDAARYLRHHDKIRAKQNTRDRSADKAKKRKQYAESPDIRLTVRAARDLWRKNNPEKMRQQAIATSRKRRARIKGAVVVETIKAAHVREMLRVQAGLCFYCHVEMDRPTLDHIQPITKGGHHSLDNVVMACGDCNRRKGNKDPFQFLRQMQGACL